VTGAKARTSEVVYRTEDRTESGSTKELRSSRSAER
jgi:hypothetical protein